MVEDFLPRTNLNFTNGVWTLYCEGQEYIRLIDATSKCDAEKQVAELLFMALFMRTAEELRGANSSLTDESPASLASAWDVG